MIPAEIRVPSCELAVVVMSRNILKNVAEGFEPPTFQGQTSERLSSARRFGFRRSRCCCQEQGRLPQISLLLLSGTRPRPRVASETTWAGSTTTWATAGLERSTTMVSVCKGTCNLHHSFCVCSLPFCVLRVGVHKDFLTSSREQIDTSCRKIGGR